MNRLLLCDKLTTKQLDSANIERSRVRAHFMALIDDIANLDKNSSMDTPIFVAVIADDG